MWIVEWSLKSRIGNFNFENRISIFQLECDSADESRPMIHSVR